MSALEIFPREIFISFFAHRIDARTAAKAEKSVVALMGPKLAKNNASASLPQPATDSARFLLASVRTNLQAAAVNSFGTTVLPLQVLGHPLRIFETRAYIPLLFRSVFPVGRLLHSFDSSKKISQTPERIPHYPCMRNASKMSAKPILQAFRACSPRTRWNK